ncbi:MAG: NUDIX domain-containing protein [Ilumatobacter sp.]|uniref:NUDIX domain-containing protein n=1 Tax=Ilumatobacter sp. TaxID=1967498 RepID=UPI00391E008E
MFCSFCGQALADLPPTQCRHCGEHHWNNPKPSGSAIVERDGRALLVKRAREPWREFWDVPGGFCDPAEHHADAALREVTEETGLVALELTGYLGAWMDVYPDERTERGERPVESTLNHYYVARQLDDGPLQPDAGEVLEARYFRADELPDDIAFPDHIRPALQAWIEGLHPDAEQRR